MNDKTAAARCASIMHNELADEEWRDATSRDGRNPRGVSSVVPLMQRLGIGLLLTAWAGVGIGAEPDLPCENVADPTALSTMCGYAKPEDVQFMASKSAVIISEQGWKAPSRADPSLSSTSTDEQFASAGSTRCGRRSRSEGRSRPIGDPGCTTPPAASFSPHGLSVLEQRSSVRLAIINHARPMWVAESSLAPPAIRESRSRAGRNGPERDPGRGSGTASPLLHAQCVR